MEARLRAPDDAGVELQYLYNGRLVHARRWPARDAAIADANARLRHLLIGGWATHW